MALEVGREKKERKVLGRVKNTLYANLYDSETTINPLPGYD
jgi:hypothetical protein